jgi:superfamily II DNA helicase RecQ
MRQFRTFRVGLEESGTDSFNRFLRNVRALSVDKKFVESGEGSFWVFLVEYEVAQENASGRKERVDYKEVLPPEQFLRFDNLRKLRQDLAKAAGVPAYSVFTNEMAEAMVKIPEPNITRLKEIAGFGDQKAESYGAKILSCLLGPLQ